MCSSIARFSINRASFTHADVRKYVSDLTKPLPEMLDLFPRLKQKYNLKIAVVSNEGRELTFDRVERFNLKSFVDFFIVSSFVHLRKPDTDIYQLALDVAMVEPQQVVYVDDRPMLVEVATSIGINGIQHADFETTKSKLAAFGLTL